MEKMRWNEKWPFRIQPSVITLGFFDGLHLGHGRLAAGNEPISKGMSCKYRDDESSSRILPYVLMEKQPVPLIYGLTEKEWVVNETQQIDHLGHHVDFEPELMDMEPEQFVNQILVENFHAVGVVNRQ